MDRGKMQPAPRVFPGLLRWLPAAAAILGLVALVLRPGSATPWSGGALLVLAVVLEWSGWAKAARARTGPIAVALFAGALVMAGVLATATLLQGPTADRIAAR